MKKLRSVDQKKFSTRNYVENLTTLYPDEPLRLEEDIAVEEES